MQQAIKQLLINFLEENTSSNCMKTFHTLSKTYRLTAGLNTLCVYEGERRQNDGNSRRKKKEEVEVELYGGKFGGEKEKWLFKNTKTESYNGDTEHREGPVELERVYLLKNARSFLASTVSRRVSLPAPVVTVSMVTVWLAADSFLPSSSSLSELLEEELSDATKGAFLATQTLHTHASDTAEEKYIKLWIS